MFSRSTPLRFIAGAAAALCVARASSVSAEPPWSWEASGGYTAMRDLTDHVTFKRGWMAGTSVFLNPWLSFAVEIDHQTATTPAFDGGTFSFASRSALAGFRATGRLGVLTEFGQVLIGRVDSSGTIFDQRDKTRHVAIQPGLGVDLAIRGRWSARGEVDARFLDSGREARLVAALVYRIR